MPGDILRLKAVNTLMAVNKNEQGTFIYRELFKTIICNINNFLPSTDAAESKFKYYQDTGLRIAHIVHRHQREAG